MDEALEALVPSIVRPYVGWIVGMDWPEADEDAIFQKVTVHTAAGKSTEGAATSGDITFAAVKSCVDGVAADSFGKYWDQFTKADPQFLPKLTEACNEAARQLQSYGLDVEYTKYMIVFSLILLAFQIAYFIALAVPSFGASLSLIPEACTITQMGVRQLGAMLLRNILVSTAVMEGMDFAIQNIQKLEGHRTGWDWEKTKGSIEGGVMTGLAFTAMAGLFSKVGGSRMAEGVMRGDMTGREKFAAFMTNSVGGHMLQSSTANMLGSVPMLAASGQLDLEHLVKAGTSGLVGAADGHLIKPTGSGGFHGPVPSAPPHGIPNDRPYPEYSDSGVGYDLDGVVVHPDGDGGAATHGPPPFEPARILSGEYQGPPGDGGAVPPAAAHVPVGDHAPGAAQPVTYAAAGHDPAVPDPVVPHQGDEARQTVAYDPGVSPAGPSHPPAALPPTALADAHTPVLGDGHSPMNAGARPAQPFHSGPGQGDHAGRPQEQQPAAVPVASMQADGHGAAPTTPGEGGRGTTPLTPGEGKRDPAPAAQRPEPATPTRPDQPTTPPLDQTKNTQPTARTDQAKAVQQAGRGGESPSGDGAPARDGDGLASGQPSGRPSEVVVTPVDRGRGPSAPHAPHTDTPAPHTDTPAPHTDTPAPHTGEPGHQHDVSAPQRLSGDGWTQCERGETHWGRYGAAGLLLTHRGADGEVQVLMQHRGGWAGEETWGTVGGAKNGDESAVAAALREASEESDLDPSTVQVRGVFSDDHGGWSYDTVISSVSERVDLHGDGYESRSVRWVPVSEVESLPLHAGFAETWPAVRTEMERLVGHDAPAGGPAGPPHGTPDPHGTTAAHDGSAGDGHTSFVRDERLAAHEDGMRRFGLHDLGPDFRSTPEDRRALREHFGDERFQGVLDGIGDSHKELQGSLRRLWSPEWEAVENGLPPEDQAALFAYTTLEGPSVNQALREGDLEAIGRYAPLIKCVTSALNQMPHHTGPVFRGIQLDPHQMHELDLYKPGDLIREPAFISTSSDPRLRFGGNVEFVMASETGRQVAPGLHAKPNVEEVLFPPDTHFRVLDIERTENSARVFLQEVVDVPGTLAPALRDPQPARSTVIETLLGDMPDGQGGTGSRIHDLLGDGHGQPAAPPPSTPGPNVIDELVQRHGSETVDAAVSGVHAHAQGNWERPYQRVPTDDLTSARLFAQSDHRPINEALYGGHEEDLTPYSEQVHSVDTALENLPTFEGPVHRVVDLDPVQRARYRPGEVVREPGYVIASANPHGQFHGNTEFVIESRAGRAVGPAITEHATDHEVHFRRDTAFEVTGVEHPPDGGTRVHLREVVESGGTPVPESSQADHALLLDRTHALFGEQIPPEQVTGDHVRYTEALTDAALRLYEKVPDYSLRASDLQGLHRLVGALGAAPGGVLAHPDILHDLVHETLGRDPMPWDVEGLARLADHLNAMGGRREFEPPADALCRAAADLLGTLPGSEPTERAIHQLSEPQRPEDAQHGSGDAYSPATSDPRLLSIGRHVADANGLTGLTDAEARSLGQLHHVVGESYGELVRVAQEMDLGDKKAHRHGVAVVERSDRGAVLALARVSHHAASAGFIGPEVRDDQSLIEALRRYTARDPRVWDGFRAARFTGLGDLSPAVARGVGELYHIVGAPIPTSIIRFSTADNVERLARGMGLTDNYTEEVPDLARMFVHAQHAGDITPDVRDRQALIEGLTRHKELASTVVERELSTRDLADLYKHAEKRGFYGLEVDRREGVVGVLRRAAGELGPDELAARHIARHLDLELDDATIGAVRQLNDALDPGDRDRTTARGVGHFNWLAHNVRADLPARELPATYLRARDAAFYGENAAGREGLVRALRQADRQLHPHPAPADLTGLPEPTAWDSNAQVLQRLIDEAAVPSERWPVSGGPSPYGPIDHLAAAADPGIFRNSPLDTYLDRWRRLEEEFPDVGWRTDRKLLFRGDTRSDVEGILEAGFHPNPANNRTNEHGLVCFSRAPDVALRWAGNGEGPYFLYVIDAPGGYDHHAVFDEVFFPGGVDRKFVVGAWIFHGMNRGSLSFKDSVEWGNLDWFPNPRYDPDS